MKSTSSIVLVMVVAAVSASGCSSSSSSGSSSGGAGDGSGGGIEQGVDGGVDSGVDAQIGFDSGITEVTCGAGSASGLSTSGDAAEMGAEQTQLAVLDAFVGRYVRGDVPVYRGTVTAHDNASVLGPNEPDGDIPMGAAIADLNITSTDAQLYVTSVATGSFVQVEQPSGASSTNIYEVLEADSSGGQEGSCTSCAPDLASHPSSIAVDASVMYVSSDAPSPLVISLTTSLAVASPCTLTFADLLTFKFRTAQLEQFVANGPEMVWHVSDTYFEPDSTGCGPSTPYTIDLFVESATPWVYGVRNYAAGATTTMCQRTTP